MRFELICNDKLFYCSASYWNNIRSNIIKATFDYIEYKIIKDGILDKNLDSDSDLEIDSYLDSDFDTCDKTISEYYHHIKTIYNLKDFLRLETNNINIGNFIKLSHYTLYSNSLNYFDVIGLFYICEQKEYYSPGNSLDIFILFDKIKPFTKKYGIYDYIYSEELHMTCLQNVVNESYTKLRDVKISR